MEVHLEILQAFRPIGEYVPLAETGDGQLEDIILWKMMWLTYQIYYMLHHYR
ncbi:MAG: hypothetical protein CM1200mP3_12740 [Chloroflexota bacterium]|nr:MAG: hypothetical protein CM1200mP3_12740 [Chloroflexota bacterium]